MSISIRGAGDIRRFLAQRQRIGAVASQAEGSAPKRASWLKRQLSRAVISTSHAGYRALVPHRRRLIVFLSKFSRRVQHATSEDGVGGKLLRLAIRALNEEGRGWIAHPTLTLAEYGLIGAIQLHLVVGQKISAERLARILNLLFRDKIRSRRGLTASAYFVTLCYCRRYDRLCAEAPRLELIQGDAINLAAGIAHMYCRNDIAACHYLERAAQSGAADAIRNHGRAHLLAGRLNDARTCFASAAARDPKLVMAHQNAAGSYHGETYKPTEFEIENAGEFLMYDNAMQLGEGFYHIGRYDDTFRCYARAIEIQAELMRRWPLPAHLRAAIAEVSPRFDNLLPVRILGYEWVTLVGHYGFLDAYLVMVKAGLIPLANRVLLAPEHKVANEPLLALFAEHFIIVRDKALVDALHCYSRMYGDQFMAFPSHGDLAEPWPQAAARAIQYVSAEGATPFVRLSDAAREAGLKRLRAIGIPDDAWYVALHVREGGFHGDGAGTTRAHRSASVESYLQGIEEITKRGGWVVRLGDNTMSPFPAMPGLVDYALSAMKSPEMDVFLLATSALFIGTTSGLSSAAQIFRRPMLLVNCISNDCQYWTSQTQFIPKRVYDCIGKRYVPFRQIFRQPTQAMLVDANVMARAGLEARANSSDEIAAAIRDALDEIEAGWTVSSTIVAEEARARLSENPYAFGAARPCASFLALMSAERSGSGAADNCPRSH